MAPTGSSNGGGVGPSRRTWDKDEYASKASSRQRQNHELAEVNSKRREQGLPPLKKLKSDEPEPTQAMQERRGPLDLDKNQGKTLMVDMSSGAGERGQQRGPGFYCDVCRKLLKDNLAYLDHVNGRVHLMRIGQSTQQDRATLQDVKAKFAELRERMGQDGAQSKSMAYDFDARIKAIAEAQEREDADKKDKKREERLRKKQKKTQVDDDAIPPPEPDSEDAMMAAMGFGGFGSTKK